MSSRLSVCREKYCCKLTHIQGNAENIVFLVTSICIHPCNCIWRLTHGPLNAQYFMNASLSIIIINYKAQAPWPVPSSRKSSSHLVCGIPIFLLPLGLQFNFLFGSLLSSILCICSLQFILYCVNLSFILKIPNCSLMSLLLFFSPKVYIVPLVLKISFQQLQFSSCMFYLGTSSHCRTTDRIQSKCTNDMYNMIDSYGYKVQST